MVGRRHTPVRPSTVRLLHSSFCVCSVCVQFGVPDDSPTRSTIMENGGSKSTQTGKCLMPVSLTGSCTSAALPSLRGTQHGSTIW